MRAPSITRQAILASGTPVALLTNGTVREARGLASITYRSPPWTANWTLRRPTTPSAERDAAGLLADGVEHVVAERVRRQHAGRVAGVDTGLLDVLHDPADPHLLAVAQGVDVDLGRVLEEAVEEDLPLAAVLGPGQVVAQAGLVVDDLHGAAAKDVGRAHEQREPDRGRAAQRVRD